MAWPSTAAPRRPVTAPDTAAGVLRRGEVRSLLQPVVDLDSRAVVGYEALARGTGELERPDLLFAAARREGVLPELDQACTVAAFRAAGRLGLGPKTSLFVNVEPSTLDRASAARLARAAENACPGARVVLEITERALAARPTDLLRTVEEVRATGWSIALDDVGADPASLTFLALLRPDIIKLDMGLVQRRPDRTTAEVVHAVNAHAERSGALVLAEGVETEEHVVAAVAMGATLGQGWLYGRPADHLAAGPAGSLVLPEARPHPAAGRWSSPFELVDASAVRRAPKRLLLQLSRQLEAEALRIGGTAVVVSTFQEARHLSPGTLRHYAELSRATGFVCVLGAGVLPAPVEQVRGIDLVDGDPLRDEWDVVVISPHFTVALLAREVTGPVAERPDADRLFDYVLTYERSTVVAAAHRLLGRGDPCGATTRTAGTSPTANATL